MTRDQKYAALDAAICEHIKTTAHHPTYSTTLNDMAMQLLGRTPQTRNGTEWRLIDRRMQALRKAGRIKHERATINGVGGWRIAQ